jgi:hypothetical protein
MLKHMQLKCSREPSQCARCARLGRHCTYPEPPDRRYLASIRAPPRKRQRTLEGATDPEVPALHHASIPGCNGLSHKPAPDNSAPGSPSSPMLMPSREAQKVLIDVYFVFAFNSSLIFHKPTLLQQWSHNKVDKLVLLSMCAMATRLERNCLPCSLFSSIESDLIFVFAASRARLLGWHEMAQISVLN